jgi:concanavalin A-like lectin/glucanase superfamily protein
MSYDSIILADNPAIFLPLDDLLGSTTVLDKTTGRRNGTVNGGVTLGVPGASSDGHTSALFDGTSGYIAFASAPVSVPPLTIEFAARWDSTNPFLGVWDSAPNQQNVLRHFSESTSAVKAQGFEWWQDTNLNFVPADQRWHLYHVIFSYGPNRQLDLWADGVQIGSVLGGNSAVLAWAASWVLGNINGGTAGWFKGTLQKFAVYPVKLTPLQILQHKAAFDDNNFIILPPPSIPPGNEPTFRSDLWKGLRR